MTTWCTLGTEYGGVTKVAISPHFPLEFSSALFGLAYKPSFKRYFTKCQLIYPFGNRRRRVLARNFMESFECRSYDRDWRKMSVFTELKEIVYAALLWGRKEKGRQDEREEGKQFHLQWLLQSRNDFSGSERFQNFWDILRSVWKIKIKWKEEQIFCIRFMDTGNRNWNIIMSYAHWWQLGQRKNNEKENNNVFVRGRNTERQWCNYNMNSRLTWGCWKESLALLKWTSFCCEN